MAGQKAVPITRIFTREFMLDLLYEESDDGGAVVSDEITGKSRWAAVHTLVFRAPDGKLYRCKYNSCVGDEGESPWQYTPEVECSEVRAVERVVVAYEDVTAPVKS